MKKNPKVSILCLTYNQKLFITQALDSFLMQKTDFDFEILIHDDASTDGTTKIIRQYQKKYPSIIKIIVQKENQFSKGNSEILTEYLFPLVKGKYIALCEGDDFFTDESKLQTQAEFLDNNPKCSLCFHPTRVIFENYQNDEYLFPDVKKSKDFSLAALIKENFIQTNSVMYRKQKYTDLPKNKILPGDWYLHMYHAQFGKIGYIDKVMSVYRRHPGGIWWEAYKNPDALIEKVGIEYLTMHVETMALFGKNPEYREIIINNFTKLLNYYVAVSKKTITESFKKELAEATEVSIKTGSNLLKKELLLLNIKNKNLEKRFFEIEYLSDLKNEIYKLEFRRDLIFKSVWFRLWKMYSTIKL